MWLILPREGGFKMFLDSVLAQGNQYFFYVVLHVRLIIMATHLHRCRDVPTMWNCYSVSISTVRAK